MRLIDADAFDKCLEEAEIEATKNQKYVFSSAINTIRGNLANFPTVNQWIPCSERLPDEKGEYLVTYHPCYWDNVQQDIKVGIDSFRGKTSWAKKKHQRVIAWQPLPEPWKGEEE